MSPLTCTNGICRIPQLSDLDQNDPLIRDTDPSIPQFEVDVGCYNTAIVAVANAALANRSARLSRPHGRTAVFDDLTSTVNDAGDPVSKAMNQLIWQYHRQLDHNAGTGPIYYLHELVRDFAGFITQDHDPQDYGKCWGPASNHAGAAFRDDVWTSRHVSFQYIATLLDNGFAPLIAFGRYTPNAAWNEITGKWDVEFRAGTPHKVVLSGRRSGAYPLLIHDVADGVEKRVRLRRGGPDLRAAPRGFGNDQARGSALGALSWTTVDADGNVITHRPHGGTYLEYEGTITSGQEVFFIEHVDAVSLDWSSGSRVFSGTWGQWTDFADFRVSGRDYLLAYDRGSGTVQFSRVFDGLQGTEAVWQGTWGHWTHLVPFTSDGTDYLLTYDSRSRAAMISRFFGDLNGVETIWSGTWGAWTNLAVFQRHGRPYLLAYDSATGTAQTSEFFAGLQGTNTIWQGAWGTWSTLVPMDGGDATYLVAYEATNGKLQLARFFPGLNGVEALHERSIAPQSGITALRYPGPPHFVVHDQALRNRRQLFRISPDGRLHDIVSAGGGISASDSGVPIGTSFVKDRATYQLMYWPATRHVRFFRWTCL